MLFIETKIQKTKLYPSNNPKVKEVGKYLSDIELKFSSVTNISPVDFKITLGNLAK